MTATSPAPSSSPSPRPSGRWGTVMAGLGTLAACAVCCAGPLLALLGGVGLTSAVGAVWVPALAAVAVAAVLALVLLRRRRRSASCRSGETGPVDVGMPAVSDRPGR